MSYDELVIAAGPWTNSLLALGRMQPSPVAPSNEQKIHYMPTSGREDDYMVGNIPTILRRAYPSNHCEHALNTYSLPRIPNSTPGFIVSAHGQGNLMNREDEFPVPDWAVQKWVLDGKTTLLDF